MKINISTSDGQFCVLCTFAFFHQRLVEAIYSNINVIYIGDIKSQASVKLRLTTILSKRGVPFIF